MRILALIALLALLTAPARPVLAQEADPTSPDPRVKFKDGERYLRDLAESLEIPRSAICLELSRYDCADKAFRIVLGGVDPYDIRIMQPLDQASLASPIAFDRVALQVCSNRIAKDKADPATAVLFKPAAGRPDAAWRAALTDRVYDRILRRDADEAERQRMSAFLQGIEARTGRSPKGQADQTILACFALASSAEAAFY
ncbi:MAG: hypothetical protein IM667_05375 [Phenylobacterium sp.]|uniref:hypothetical protein n=1 Tax=Phenylobacterium sp. TaxID=1871053 RepID=UPI0026009EA6|nr:hypothetical protein [Phenylobacterium sp.]MCA3712485.1 hypothetical protein [Phenylobacterium sp.]MCA3723885.1 hypothetical protein [Phenylobacterium sp.]MCA3727356.1 hypothetical protein [Phenylobacterium sp.]MCA6229265.1 hypothetical protein [Phenylobacterium sp.]MCA6240048.1 hypothetical protein [Phenylobacterium sp.]